MAKQEHLDILKQGVVMWNQWRAEHAHIEANLSKANFNKANLSKANLNRANLSGADLSGANLSGANLNKANLSGANLTKADLSGASLRGAHLTGVHLIDAHLTGAHFRGAYLRGAHLTGVNFTGTNLSGANLRGTDLTGANFTGADLTEANLRGATLVGTSFVEAILTNCKIYGISAWDVNLKGAIQNNLAITPETEPTITVDNLEVAQFIYLLLHNPKIRDVIDTIARKAVLILGRFTPERKSILDALREALRAHGYIPIVFDFDKPSSQDLTETVSTLAHLSRFIIADLTDPSSIPYELHVVVPNRMVPVLPLLKVSRDPITGDAIPEFVMFRDLRKKYHWVLPIHIYKDLEDLLASLEAKVISPAEQKAQELAGSDTHLGTHTMSP